jgi:hypothetical protein
MEEVMKCKHCGNVGFAGLYDIRKPKRKRYEIKNELFCPVCKSHMETNQSYMTAEENAARQLGLPCVSNDGGTYQPAVGYFTTYVCKRCGGEL